MPVAAEGDPDDTIHVDPPQARNPSEVASSDRVEAIPSFASPVTNTPQGPGENIPPTVPSKPQPKRARRGELPEELIARDLDWFKSTQSSAIVNNDPGASSSKVGESSPALASDTRQSPLPKKKTFRMVPSRRLPRRIPLDATQGVKSGISTSTLLPASEPLAEKGGSCENAQDIAIQMDVDEHNPSLERLESDARSAAVPEARNVQKVSRPEDLPFTEPQLITASSNEPSIEPQIPQTDYQSSSVERPSTNGETPISASPPTSFPKASLDRMESTDIGTSDLGSESRPSEPPSKPESTPPQSPPISQFRSPILPPLVNALEPPLNLNFRISQTSPDQPQELGIAANQRRFDDEMTVIHITQGKPFTHTHMIDISLSESIFSNISKWVNRKSHPSYVANYLGVQRT